jgi:hypothetical protein
MTGKLFALLILSGFAGLLIFATVYKYFEVRIASRWPSVPGRVLSSKVVQRKTGGIGKDESDIELRNFAEITYEYQVQGRRHRANRVSIGEDLGNFQVQETIAKYPKDARVMVFYNPAKPGEAVLERDPPEGIFKFMLWLIGGLIVIGLTLIFGAEPFVQFLKMFVPAGGNTPLAVILACMGLFALLVARAASYEAKKTGGWSSTSGVIEESGVESFQALHDGRFRTMNRSNVVYLYKVDGNEYRSGRIAVRGWKASSNIGALVGGLAKKYPPGKPVEVFYDPANPAEAVLERRVSGGSFVYVIAFALLAAAAKAAGLF